MFYTKLLICFFSVIMLGNVNGLKAQTAELWAEVEKTVQEGDFRGYANLYHDDAVLVNSISGQIMPISGALDGWKQGFEDTKAGLMEASVEFRFSERISDKTTAHETGIFKYSSKSSGEAFSTTYVHFEALSIKTENGWKMLMERQLSIATEEEWKNLNE